MIVVTGANGQLGRLIVEKLCTLTREPFVATARDLAKMQGFEGRSVETRQADFALPETLAAAFAGATQVLIVSSNAQNYGGSPLAQHRAAIAAAKSAGVRRIVYTSHMGANAASAFSPMHTHVATETMLKDSGVRWTALRNGFYASTIPRIVGNAQAHGAFDTPPDGRVSWTTHSDLAEAAARILLDAGRFEGPTPPLTATQAVTFDEIAASLSTQLGKDIAHRTVSEADYSASLVRYGLPAATVGILVQMFRAAHAGEFAEVDPTLSTLLGRPALLIGDYLESLSRSAPQSDEA